MHLTDRQLMARAEGPLDEAAEAHLAACAACRAAAAETAAVWRHLPEAALDISPSFDARLRARLDVEDERRAGWFDWLRASPILAAVAGIVLITLGPSAPSPESAPHGELEMLSELELLDDLDAAELVDVYEDLELIEGLDEGEG